MSKPSPYGPQQPQVSSSASALSPENMTNPHASASARESVRRPRFSARPTPTNSAPSAMLPNQDTIVAGHQKAAFQPK
jgi:hypothetical protein